MPISQYEIERAANIERNKAILAKLEIPKDIFPVKAAQKPKKSTAPKKRKVEIDETSEDSPAKFSRTDSDEAPSAGSRRSARNAGKKIDYKAELYRGLPPPVAGHSSKPGNTGPLGAGGSGKKMYVCLMFNFRVCLVIDTKVSVKFGSIPGIEVGTWWKLRYNHLCISPSHGS